MYQFQSHSHYMINGHHCFSVENPHQCDDFSHLEGQSVYIDEQEYTILGVERNAKMPPFWKGEKIGLMVK